MTTWGETNHDGEADRIYRERLFDPTLEAPFLDTTNTHLGRAQRCLALACGTAPPSPATERAVRALDGRASEGLPGDGALQKARQKLDPEKYDKQGRPLKR